jgi:hypothetical protein
MKSESLRDSLGLPRPTRGRHGNRREDNPRRSPTLGAASKDQSTSKQVCLVNGAQQTILGISHRPVGSKNGPITVNSCLRGFLLCRPARTAHDYDKYCPYKRNRHTFQVGIAVRRYDRVVHNAPPTPASLGRLSTRTLYATGTGSAPYLGRNRSSTNCHVPTTMRHSQFGVLLGKGPARKWFRDNYSAL